MTRENAVGRALACYDDDSNEGYYKRLGSLVAVKTESQNPDRLDEHTSYVKDHMTPALERLGYACRIYDNPFEGCGPVFLAHRLEDQSLPTLLCYGHGDVVLGMEGEWDKDQDPWLLTFEDEKVYGRGTADNKGQHLAHMVALEAVIETRGKLGFNSKVVIELGEENGSKGFAEVIAANRDDFQADAFFSSDGPRAEISHPNISLGNRGCVNFNLVVDLREGGHHSGNWGGLLRSPAVILTNALATIVTPNGQILIEEWRPKNIPDSVRNALKGVSRDAGENAPAMDENWGESDLTMAEKVSIWNSFEMLAMEIGNPDAPVNAVPPNARAWCQLRHVIETPQDTILDALRAHLDEHGFSEVIIEEPPEENRGEFAPGRTNPDQPWALWLKEIVERVGGKPCGVVSCSGGSLRTPATFCGVVGFRPSPGLVPRITRAASLLPMPVLGPMARSVEDAHLLLLAQLDADKDDPYSSDDVMRIPDALSGIDLGSLKVAFSSDLGCAPLDKKIAKVFESRKSAISHHFAEIQDRDPDLTDVHETFEILRAVQFVAAHKERLEKNRDQLGPNVIDNTERGMKMSLPDVAWAHTAQSELYFRFRRFFDDADILICPAAAVSPFPHAQLSIEEINGEKMPTYMRWLAMTYALTMALPSAVCLPCGIDHLGMPFGIQVVGPIGSDAFVLEVAFALEQALEGVAETARPVPDLAKLAEANK